MFDNLSDKLEKALHNLKGHGKITEINVAETLKEVRRALLDADVNYKIAKDFTNNVKEKALGQPADGRRCCWSEPIGESYCYIDVGVTRFW